MSTYSPRGSLWHRWDLHFHTPSSYDYEDKSVTNKDIVEALVANNVRVVAVTDHHNIDITRIRELQELGKDKLTVLPGIELRSDQGGDPIHYICIFPEDCDLNHVWTTLQGSLGLTSVAICEKGGDQCVYVPLEKGAEETRKLGGVLSIHAGAKTNSIEGIRNKEQFQQRIKYDITNNWVDLMELGQIKDIDIHLNTVWPVPSTYKMHMTNWKIQIDPRQVHYLKFILEGYDNLATMSTVDRRQGIVELYISSDNEDLVRELLVSIKTEIGLKTEYRIQKSEVGSWESR